MKQKLRFNRDDLAGFKRWQQGQHLWHEWSRVNEPDAHGSKHYDCETNSREILLEGQIAIASDENLEFRLGQRQ